jgi:hypothetical protein
MNEAYEQHPERFRCWAVVELMGHSKTAGLVSEQNIAGEGMIRVDVPGKDGETRSTRFYSPDAVYCITPVDKQLAVGYALHHATQPVSVYDLRKLIDDKKVGQGEQEYSTQEDFEA